MKKRLKLTNLLFSALALLMFCIMNEASHAQSQTIFAYPTYGGNTSPNTVQWGPYANTAAYFDSAGTLRGGSGGNCVSCPAPTTTYTKSVVLTTAQVKALNSTPDTIVSLRGTSNASISLVSAYVTMNYNSTTYTADSVLQLKAGTAILATNQSTIDQTSSGTQRFTLNSGRTAGNILSGQGLVLTTATANPTVGNSSIIITVVYTVQYLGQALD